MRLSVVCLVLCKGLHYGLVGTSVLLSVIVDDKHHHVLCNLHPRFTSADLFYTSSTLLYLSDCRVSLVHVACFSHIFCFACLCFCRRAMCSLYKKLLTQIVL